MAASDELRKLVWESMLNADYLQRFYGELASRKGRAGFWLDVTLAIAATGTFASIISQVPYLSAMAALLTTVLGWYAVFGKFGESAKEIASLHRQWAEIYSEYRMLWATLPNVSAKQTRSEIERLEARAGSLSEIAASRVPRNKKLENAAFDEMLHAHGLTHAGRASA